LPADSFPPRACVGCLPGSSPPASSVPCRSRWCAVRGPRSPASCWRPRSPGSRSRCSSFAAASAATSAASASARVAERLVVGGGVKGATPLAVEGKPPDDGGARGRHRGRLPSWVVNLGLVLAAVAVTLGALEIALRVLGVQTASYHPIAGVPVSDPILGWTLAPPPA